MKKQFLLLFICLSISTSAMAQGYVITEWMSFVERTLQQVTEEISNFDFDDVLGTKKEEKQAQDPTADGNPSVNENAGSVPISEIPPYADATLRTELAKDNPSIPTVNDKIKDTLTFKSETAEKEGDAYLKSGDFDVNATTTNGGVSSDKAENTQNTLEKQQAHYCLCQCARFGTSNDGFNR